MIQRIVGRDDIDNLLKDLKSSSKLFMNMNMGHPRHHDHQNKHYGFVFYDDQDTYADQFKLALDRVRINADGDVEYHGSSESHQVLALQERGAYSLGMLSMLTGELGNEWNAWYESSVYRTRSRGDIIEWITWSKTDEELRSDARLLYLLGVALQIIKFHGATEYRYMFTPVNPVDPGIMIFTNDLGESVRRLTTTHSASSVRARLQEDIRKVISTKESDAVVRSLIDFAKESNNRFNEDGQQIGADMIWDYLYDYIKGNKTYYDIYIGLYPDPWQLHMIRKDEEGRDVYYCPNCKQTLGYTSTALYITEYEGGKSKKVKKCAYCKKSLEGIVL